MRRSTFILLILYDWKLNKALNRQLVHRLWEHCCLFNLNWCFVFLYKKLNRSLMILLFDGYYFIWFKGDLMNHGPRNDCTMAGWFMLFLFFFFSIQYSVLILESRLIRIARYRAH